MNFLFLAVVGFFFIWFSWRMWGEKLAGYLSNPNKAEKDKVIEKAEENLKDSEDELEAIKEVKNIQREIDRNTEDIDRIKKQ